MFTKIALTAVALLCVVACPIVALWLWDGVIEMWTGRAELELC